MPLSIINMIPQISGDVPYDYMPEKNLMIAILAASIKDFHSRKSQEKKESRQWLYHPNNEDTFSFKNICEALELDEGVILQALEKTNVFASSKRVVFK